MDTESDRVTAGDDARRARRSTACPVGLSICYDLRFPELYRALALAGAKVLTVPANFMERTGRDHWEVLLRARAIENGAYVLAPSQIGGPRAVPGLRAVHGHRPVGHDRRPGARTRSGSSTPNSTWTGWTRSGARSRPSPTAGPDAYRA